MNIKTLSQITPLMGDIHISAYMGISQYSPGADKYFSRKVSYSQLTSQLSCEIDAAVMQNKYHAIKNGSPVNISALNVAVNTIQNGNCSFNGIKTFQSVPVINATVNTSNQNNATNVKCVQDMIDSRAGFIAEGQSLPVNPRNGTDGYTYYDEYVENPQQMYWHIDHGQKDSSEWIDKYGAKAGDVICKYTGNLVCYGWLADNGNVKPGQAWVGLFGHVRCGTDSSSKWVALQIQPWIIGKYSSTSQYVGFNIPVKAGLHLKIKTGFEVNGNNSGLHGDRPTLMFADAGNMPNTFVGYIVRN